MDKFLSIIMPIKDETGLDVELYNTAGDRVATTDPASKRMLERLPEMLEPIVQDPITDTTVFNVNVRAERYVGIVAGAGTVSRNYAALVARLIEAGMSGIDRPTDKTAEYRALLMGEMNRAQTEQFCAKYPDVKNQYVLLFDTDDRKGLLEYLIDLAADSDAVFTMTRRTVVLLKDAAGLEEYQSASDFAHMACENAEQELGIKTHVGIGEQSKNPTELAPSYVQAMTALRLGKLLDSKAHVFNAKDYFLVTLFEELPKEQLQKFLSKGVDVGLEEIFNDPEMMETADQFLLGSLNISETARNMYMHRNTLIYRLDKIEKATGLNIRRFTDAMTFRTLSMLYKLK